VTDDFRTTTSPTDAQNEKPAPDPDALAAAIRRALIAAPPSGPHKSAELERAVQAFGRAARAANTRPRRLLVTLAAMIEDSMPSETSDWWRQVLRDRVTLWAIESYYHIDFERPTDSPSRPPRS
jgi:hypothetical protein